MGCRYNCHAKHLKRWDTRGVTIIIMPSIWKGGIQDMTMFIITVNKTKLSKMNLLAKWSWMLRRNSRWPINVPTVTCIGRSSSRTLPLVNSSIHKVMSIYYCCLAGPSTVEENSLFQDNRYVQKYAEARHFLYRDTGSVFVFQHGCQRFARSHAWRKWGWKLYHQKLADGEGHKQIKHS